MKLFMISAQRSNVYANCFGSGQSQCVEPQEIGREQVTRAGAFGELVGQGPVGQAVARQLDLVAPADAAFLLLGKSGTGEELVERGLHGRSRRTGRPLVKMHCAAVPREL